MKRSGSNRNSVQMSRRMASNWAKPSRPRSTCSPSGCRPAYESRTAPRSSRGTGDQAPAHHRDLRQPNRAPRSAAASTKVVGYPPLVEMDDRRRREFHEVLLDADSFEDLPGKWQAAILK